MTSRGLLALLALATAGCEPSRASPPKAKGQTSPSARAPRAATSAPPAPSTASEPSKAEKRARLFAINRHVWIRSQPDASKDWLGFLTTGSSVELKSTTPKRGVGCPAFYEIEPRGYVCVDERGATLDEHNPIFQSLLPFAPKVDSPWLHRYAESLGLALYRSTPTPELQKQLEPDLAAHLARAARARAGETVTGFEGVDLSLPEQVGLEFPGLPRGVSETRKAMSPHSTLAYSTEARFGDRAFLLTADFAWAPKDRVKPYPVVSFHGVQLGVDAKLPLAFIRKSGRPKYRRAGDGAVAPTQDAFARLAHVELTGTTLRWRGERYFETREAEVWIRELDAVIPEPRSKTPWGAALDAEDRTGRTPKGRGTWIEVSIEGGWLLAFEGTRPVYATLVSPGAGGVARPDEPALETNASPIGTYPISGKLLSATMDSPTEIVHADVPFVQNIVKPYALHGAYWHDNWGNLESGGCINLAPVDAKWLFAFTEPELPAGWHAVRWSAAREPATIVILHR